MKSNAQSMATGFAMGALFCLISMAWVDIWYTQPRPGGWGRAHFCVECERELTSWDIKNEGVCPGCGRLSNHRGWLDYETRSRRAVWTSPVNYHWEYRKP